MVAGTAAGELVDRGKGPFTVAEMQAWAKERTVRAAVLRYLLIEGQWPVDAKGVWLRGVRISGHLDLEAATLRCPLLLDCCYLDANELVCLDHVTALRISLTGCRLVGLTGRMLIARELDLSRSTLTGLLHLQDADITGQLTCRGVQLTGTNNDGDALTADRIKVGGGVFLDQKFTAAGTVRLPGANITGQLNCGGAQLNGRNNDGNALAADGIRVGGGLFLDEGFTAAGTVRLLGADIAGELNCGGAQLNGRNNDGNALAADRMRAGTVVLRRMRTKAGAIRLSGAVITGQLNCGGAQLNGRNNDGNALAADGIRVGGGIYLHEGFTAGGGVGLAFADITGQVNCRGAQLTGRNNDRNALTADGIRVVGGVYLDEGFTAAGAVRFLAADITGQLSLRRAVVTGTDSDGDALVADGMKIVGGVYLDEGFTAAGAIRLTGSDISGQLNCRGAQLNGRNNDRNALAADGMRAAEDVFLDRGFTAAGTISLQSAHVGASVHLRPTELAGENEVALNAPRAQVAGTLEWAPAGQVSGQVNLEGATAGQLDDNWSSERPNGCWPTGGRLRLDGFTYGRFGGKQQATVEQRLAWIRSQYQLPAGSGSAAFATQPYEQLAAVYRQAGQDAEARKAAIARRADLRKYGGLNRYRRFGNWFLDWSIKYGYQTWRAAAGLAAVFVIFLALSFLAQQHHLMVPVGDTDGLHYLPSATKCTSDYPCFYPFGYAIDTVIPIINVHQADNWGPYGPPPWGHAWIAGTYVATGLGWALATLLVAGYTGLVRQD